MFAAKQDSTGIATIRIKPSIGLAWDGRLRSPEAIAAADALEGHSSVGSVKIGLEVMVVRHAVPGVEIEVTGVMMHPEIKVKLHADQAIRLATIIRPPPPPPVAWNAGADKLRDKFMRGIFESAGLSIP